jgi:type I site-specific restriction endonuclease
MEVRFRGWAVVILRFIGRRTILLFDPHSHPQSWNERMAAGEFAVLYSAQWLDTDDTSAKPQSGPVCDLFSNLPEAEEYACHQVALQPHYAAVFTGLRDWAVHLFVKSRETSIEVKARSHPASGASAARRSSSAGSHSSVLIIFTGLVFPGHSEPQVAKGQHALALLFEATGQIIHFTDNADPTLRSRELFQFIRPEQLAEWRLQPDTLRRRLLDRMPPLPGRNLCDCQVSAVHGLERSLAQNKSRALIHMATGAGKIFTAITAIYRLLKFGGARRILFLVDTRTLGKQADQEFMAYTPPDDGRKFTELYNVQRLTSSSIDPHSQVCISTIQRMYSILSGEPIHESAEDISLNEVQQTVKQEKLVHYNPSIPVEEFDFITIDECHRSI